MTQKNYYDLLEIDRGADPEEIKRAYRRQAVKYHPDKNPGDKTAEERFKDISEAYEVLSDPPRREIYDHFGCEGLKGRGFGFHDPFQIFREFFGGGFGPSILDGLFGFGPAARASPRGGADIDYELQIELEDTVSGVEREIEIFRQETCSRCEGKGSEPGSLRKRCSRCDGVGEVRHTQRTIFGVFTSAGVCPACRGEGMVIESPCSSCGGRGTEEKKKKLTVQLPPGVDNGSILRKRGGGEAGVRGAPAGDLNIHVRVKPHELFQREGDDIYCELPISFALAALGGEVTVPGLNGTFRLNLPAGTQGGRVFRLRGRGIPHLEGSGRGDAHVRVAVEIPTRLNEEQKEMLRKFQQTISPHNLPLQEGFIRKLKNKIFPKENF